MSEYLLECKNLKKYFDTPRGKLHAVDDVSFQLGRGKTLGVVGDSGWGARSCVCSRQRAAR